HFEIPFIQIQSSGDSFARFFNKSIQYLASDYSIQTLNFTNENRIQKQSIALKVEANNDNLFFKINFNFKFVLNFTKFLRAKQKFLLKFNFKSDLEQNLILYTNQSSADFSIKHGGQYSFVFIRTNYKNRQHCKIY